MKRLEAEHFRHQVFEVNSQFQLDNEVDIDNELDNDSHIFISPQVVSSPTYFLGMGKNKKILESSFLISQ